MIFSCLFSAVTEKLPGQGALPQWDQKRTLLIGSTLLLGHLMQSIARFLALTLLASTLAATTAYAEEPQIGHMVFFTMKEPTAENKNKLAAACKKYLKDHDGVVYFSAGVISDDFKRDVNDREWEVALHLVFKNKAAHDKYQDHPQHLKFIDENKAMWKKVRVFDSEIK
jgi:hypothetical protein